MLFKTRTFLPAFQTNPHSKNSAKQRLLWNLALFVLICSFDQSSWVLKVNGVTVFAVHYELQDLQHVSCLTLHMTQLTLLLEMSFAAGEMHIQTPLINTFAQPNLMF